MIRLSQPAATIAFWENAKAYGGEGWVAILPWTENVIKLVSI